MQYTTSLVWHRKGLVVEIAVCVENNEECGVFVNFFVECAQVAGDIYTPEFFVFPL